MVYLMVVTGIRGDWTRERLCFPLSTVRLRAVSSVLPAGRSVGRSAYTYLSLRVPLLAICASAGASVPASAVPALSQGDGRDAARGLV